MRWLTTLVFLLGSPSASAAWAPEEADRATYSLAVTRLTQSRLEEAVDHFSEVLSNDPTCGMAIHGLAMARMRQGKAPDAARLLEDAATRYPDTATVHIGLATLRFVTGDFAGSRTAAERAVQLEPDSIDAQAALQQVLLRQGDTRGAHARINAAQKLLPKQIVACFELQLSAEDSAFPARPHALNDCQRSGSVALISAAMSRLSGTLDLSTVGTLSTMTDIDLVVRLTQAKDLAENGDPATALSLLNPLLSAHPHRTDARLLRGQVRAALGDRQGAKQDLKEAIDDSAWIDVYRSGALSGVLHKSDEEDLEKAIARGRGLLAILHIDDGELEAAAAVLATASADTLANPATQAAQARLTAQNGDVPSAQDILTRALATWPMDPDLLDASSHQFVVTPDIANHSLSAALAKSPTWQHHHNLAVNLHKRGEATQCLNRVEDARQRFGASLNANDAIRLAHVGLRCATEASDLASARRLLSRAGELQRISPFTRFNLALLEYQDDRPESAWRLIRDLVQRTPQLDEQLKTALLGLGLRTQVAMDAWDAAESIALRPETEAQDQLWFASKAAQHGHLSTAREVLRLACPRLQDDAATRCSALSANLGGVH